MLTSAERAAKGAVLLDQMGPEYWVDKIDGDRFDMDNAEDDVLGQVYGHYDKGVAALGLTEKESIEHGFNFNHSGFVDCEEDLLDNSLVKAWIVELQDRGVKIYWFGN